MTLRPRAILSLLVGGTLAGIAVPAVAGPTTPEPTRHVLVVLSSTTPTVAVGHLASAAQLRPSAGTLAAAEDAVGTLGLSAVPSADGATLDVSGPADVIDDAFGSHGYLGALRNPLGSSVAAVLDPDDSQKVFFARAPVPMTAGAIAQAYGGTQPVTGVATPDVATRPIVATIQLSGWNPASLTAYAQRSGVYADPAFDPVASGLYANRPVSQRTDSTVNCQNTDQSKSPYYLDTSGQEETTLDQEAVLGVAPTLRQWTYTAVNSSSCILSAYQSVLDDVTAGRPIVALSTSWGSCEDYLTNHGTTNAIISPLDSILQKLSLAGVTITAATGDYGKYDCTTNTGAPDLSRSASDFPASSTAVLAVGGTRHDATVPDVGWNYGDTNSPNTYGGTGGGYSGVGLTGTGFTGFGKPSWQVGTGNPATSGPSSPNGATSGTRRELPDVSIDGDPASGISAWLVSVSPQGGDDVCGQHSSNPCNRVYGGTSLSAPLMAASIAQLVANHTPAGINAIGKGLVQPVLYKSTGVFTDVTAVNDASNGACNPPAIPNHCMITFPVGAGFDEATGLGVPSFAALDGVLFGPAPGITAPATSAVGTIPLTITPPAGVTITAWYLSTTNQGCTGPGTPSAPTSTTLADGVYTLTVRGLTSDGRCTDAGVAHTIIDGVAPTLSISSWKRTDASSPRLTAKFVPNDNVGLVGVTYKVVRTDNKKVISQGVLAATARQITVTGQAGKRYTITLTPYDALRPGKVKTAGSTLPVDDRKATFRGSWSKKPMKGTYLGTISRTDRAGSTASTTVDGSTVGLLFTKVPDGGRAQLVVDGKVKKTFDTAAKKTTPDQSLTVKVKAGKHKVAIVVLGTRGSTGKGSTVTLDGFLAG